MSLGIIEYDVLGRSESFLFIPSVKGQSLVMAFRQAVEPPASDDPERNVKKYRVSANETVLILAEVDENGNHPIVRVPLFLPRSEQPAEKRATGRYLSRFHSGKLE